MTSSRFVIAAHIVTALAFNNGLVTSDCLAASVNTNPVVIRRTLGLLSRAGVVASVPGAAGGSRLARPAEKISLRDIYLAVQSDELFALHPQPPNKKCPIGAHIQAALEPVLKNAGSAMEAALAPITIADLVKRVKKADAACRRGKNP